MKKRKLAQIDLFPGLVLSLWLLQFSRIKLFSVSHAKSRRMFIWCKVLLSGYADNRGVNFCCLALNSCITWKWIWTVCFWVATQFREFACQVRVCVCVRGVGVCMCVCARDRVCVCGSVVCVYIWCVCVVRLCVCMHVCVCVWLGCVKMCVWCQDVFAGVCVSQKEYLARKIRNFLTSVLNYKILSSCQIFEMHFRPAEFVTKSKISDSSRGQDKPPAENHIPFGFTEK